MSAQGASRLPMALGRLWLVPVVCCSAMAGQKDMAWLKGKCPDGAVAWDHGGAMLLEIKTGQSKRLGSGKFLEFSTEGSFVGWNDGGKAMVYARKSGTTKQVASGIRGHVSWISDYECVVYAGGWKQIDVLTGKESTPQGLSSVTGSAVDGESDLKMTEKGYWVVLSGSSVKSNSPDKVSASRPGECSGSLSKYGYEVGGLEHSHTKYSFRSARSGGKSGSISWGISCSGKGMDNNRFSSTSRDWIVNMDECASAMAPHYIPSNDFVLVGSSAKTSGENYGDFSHVGPKLDFGATNAVPAPAALERTTRLAVSLTPEGVRVGLPHGVHQVFMHAASGDLVGMRARNGTAAVTIARGSLAPGLYVVRAAGVDSRALVLP